MEVELTQEQIEKLSAEAIGEGVSLNQLIQWILATWLRDPLPFPLEGDKVTTQAMPEEPPKEDITYWQKRRRRR